MADDNDDNVHDNDGSVHNDNGNADGLVVECLTVARVRVCTSVYVCMSVCVCVCLPSRDFGQTLLRMSPSTIPLSNLSAHFFSIQSHTPLTRISHTNPNPTSWY